MNFRLKEAALSLAPFLWASVSHAGVFTYMIRTMDHEQGLEACNTQLQVIASEFQRQSGVRLIGTECKPETYTGGLSGQIVYSAPDRVTSWSTTSTTFGEELDLFVTREQCETGLASELELFKRETGLQPFLAFCHKTSEIGMPRYRTRIDAIGTSDVRRYESGALVYHPIHEPQPAIETLNQQAIDLGLKPVAWYAGPTKSLSGLAVAHYETASSLEHYRLLAKSTLYLPTAEDCKVAFAAFDRTRKTDWAGATACSAAHPSVGFQFNLFWWDTSIAGDSVIRSTILPGTHASLEECRASAEALAAQLSNEGEKVIGIVCGHQGGIRESIRAEFLTWAK